MGFKWGLENFNHSLDEKVERVFLYKYKIKKMMKKKIDNEVQEIGITVVQTKWYDKIFDFFKRIFRK